MEIRVAGSARIAHRVVGQGSRVGREIGTRAFDLVLIMLFAPVLAVVAAAITAAVFIDSPGSVIFRSTRIGRDGRPFTIFKFRKMHAEAKGHAVTLSDDERFTPIGRFLSATRLDELPQVWNVIRGEMRLVGPRPELECFVSQFADEYEEILTVMPGITGVAQLEFLNERTLLHGHDPALAYRERILPHKLKVDLKYVRNHSLATDLVILARTALMPFRVVGRAAGSRSVHMREWGSAAGLACIVVILFALSSSNIF